MNDPKIAFDRKKLLLSLEKILPVRNLKEPGATIVRYKTILTSIKEIGVIEPLVVYPQKGKGGCYLIMDGHLRYYALRELGIKEVECLISTEDESFTYNARISRLSPVQEHRMVVKAVNNGVPIERIASALNLNVADIRTRMNLLDGIHADAVELLKDKEISAPALRLLRHVTAVRQIEIAETLVNTNNYTKSYVEALLLTSKDHLVRPQKKLRPKTSPEDIARLEHEMEALQNDFKQIDESYAQNVLCLTVIRGYVKKLLENGKTVRFLSSKQGDILGEFERIAATESL